MVEVYPYELCQIVHWFEFTDAHTTTKIIWKNGSFRNNELIEQAFNRAGSLYLACNEKCLFFTSEQPKRFILWSCQKVFDAPHYLLDNIFIRFASKLYRQIVGIPTGTNGAPLVEDFFVLL